MQITSQGILNTANIADSAITSAKIADGAIMNADINASADIALSKLLASDVAAIIGTPASTLVIYSSVQNINYHSLTASVGTKLAITSGRLLNMYAAAAVANTYNTEVTVVQGTWNYENEGTREPLAYAFRNASVNQNDEVTYPFYNHSANISIRIKANKYSSSGIVNIYVDAALVGTFDMYSAGGAMNQSNTTSVTGLALGAHTLHLKMATKNASASAYGANINEILIESA